YFYIVPGRIYEQSVVGLDCNDHLGWTVDDIPLDASERTRLKLDSGGEHLILITSGRSHLIRIVLRIKISVLLLLTFLLKDSLLESLEKLLRERDQSLGCSSKQIVNVIRPEILEIKLLLLVRLIA